MKRSRSTLIILIILPLMVQSQEQYKPSEVHEKTNVNIDLDFKYLVRLPSRKINVSEVLPLIIFLHGSGERGDNPEMLKSHGPWNYADRHPDFPFIIVAPQCREGETWEPVTLDLLLDRIIADYHVDTLRIYLTGLSRGGFGVLDWVLYKPHRFAAIAPICGASNYHVLTANILKDTPAWVFHGGMDEIIPVVFSENLVKALQEQGANARLTIYPDAGHDAWTETYLNPELYGWFLENSLKGR